MLMICVRVAAGVGAPHGRELFDGILDADEELAPMGRSYM